MSLNITHHTYVLLHVIPMHNNVNESTYTVILSMCNCTEIYVGMHVCVCVNVCARARACVHVCVYVCLRVCGCVCESGFYFLGLYV